MAASSCLCTYGNSGARGPCSRPGAQRTSQGIQCRKGVQPGGNLCRISPRSPHMSSMVLRVWLRTASSPPNAVHSSCLAPDSGAGQRSHALLKSRGPHCCSYSQSSYIWRGYTRTFHPSTIAPIPSVGSVSLPHLCTEGSPCGLQIWHHAAPYHYQNPIPPPPHHGP